jgi:hypothetical protein
MNKVSFLRSLFLVFALTLPAGCGGGSSPNPTAPLSDANVNLIFVASPDLDYQAAGDVDPSTANLTNQGLQRSLLMATYLKQQVLGTKNVTAIYALSPMTHLQTTSNYPDMAPLVTIEQFALLNQVSLLTAGLGSNLYAGYSFPINVSYSSGAPYGVVPPYFSCPGCQGLDFNDTGGNNETLLSGIVNAKDPGFYVFSAPWETINTLISQLSQFISASICLLEPIVSISNTDRSHVSTA